jgi:repressor LexA
VPDVHDPQAFAARVVGDSMAPTYKEGDIVLFAPGKPARSGDDCFVRFSKDNSTTFKRFQAGRGGKIRLHPLNKNYPVEEYAREDVNGLWPAVMRIERLR